MQHQRLLTGAACASTGKMQQAAMPVSYACPESVPAASISLNAVPAGWTPYIDSPLYLSAAAPIDGAPERRGQLAPSGERKKKGKTTLSYRLEGRYPCLLYTSPSPRDATLSRMPSSA